MSSKKYSYNDIFLRIDEIRSYYRLTQQTFADTVGVTQGYYSDIKRGRSGLSAQVIIGIAINFPDVSLKWLLTGEGEMFARESPGTKEESMKVGEEQAEYNSPASQLLQAMNSLPPHKQQAAAELLNSLLKLLK